MRPKISFGALAVWPKNLWAWLREVSGDDAYDRYLDHWRQHHAQEGGQPLDRRAYLRERQREQWNSIRRCC